MTARELRAGLVVALLGFVVALYVRSVIADVDGYGTAALARALSSVFVIAPSACATAAWRGSVLRRAAAVAHALGAMTNTDDRARASAAVP